MSVWIGGLVVLLFVLPGATRRLEPPERSRLLAAVLVRFSPIALACVGALLATGVTQALIDMGGLAPLLHTAFGRAVLIKFVLLLALVGLGAVNRQRVVPALRRLAAGGQPPGGAGRVLRAHAARGGRARGRRARGDLGAGQLRAAEVGGRRARSRRPSAWARSSSRLTVDPARVGANQLHVYLFDARTGAPYTKTKELTVQASLPSKRIGPLDATMSRAGPGPLRRQHPAARARRRLAAGRDRSRLGLRRVHDEAEGAGAVTGRPRTRVALAVLLVAAVAVLGLHVGGLDTGLLFMAPAFALALPLLAGRYLGEGVLVGARARPARRRRRSLCAIRPHARLLPRGGLLVGHALAGRAPPA